MITLTWIAQHWLELSLIAAPAVVVVPILVGLLDEVISGEK